MSQAPNEDAVYKGNVRIIPVKMGARLCWQVCFSKELLAAKGKFVFRFISTANIEQGTRTHDAGE